MEHSSVGRLLGVLLSPVKTFQSIAQRPTWIVALLVVTLVGVGFAMVTFPKVDWEAAVIAEIDKTNPDLSGSEREQAIAIGSKFAQIFPWIAVVLGPLIGTLLIGGLMHGGMKIVGGEQPFKSTLSTVVYSGAPWLLSTLLTIPIALGRDEVPAEELEAGLLSSNLGALAGEDTSAMVKAALSSFDVFSIWNVLLLIVGLSIVGKRPRGSVAGVVIGLWLLWILIKVGLASFG